MPDAAREAMAASGRPRGNLRDDMAFVSEAHDSVSGSVENINVTVGSCSDRTRPIIRKGFPGLSQAEAGRIAKYFASILVENKNRPVIADSDAQVVG